MSENNQRLRAGDILQIIRDIEEESGQSTNRQQIREMARDRVCNILGTKELTPTQESLISQYVTQLSGGPQRRGPGFFSIPTEDRFPNKR